MIINMNGAKAPETPSPVLQEKTVTPETLPTVIGADEGYDGLSQVTVNPDPQLIPTNIRSGKTIFGVEGSFVGSEVSAPTDLLSYCYDNNIYLKSYYNGYVGYTGTNVTTNLAPNTAENHYQDPPSTYICWATGNQATLMATEGYSKGSWSSELSYALNYSADSVEWSKITDIGFHDAENITISARTPCTFVFDYIVNVYLSAASQYGGLHLKDNQEVRHAEVTGTLSRYDPIHYYPAPTITFDEPLHLDNVKVTSCVKENNPYLAGQLGNIIAFPSILKAKIEW